MRIARLLCDRRLRGAGTDSKLPQLTQKLLSPAPISQELEIAKLSFGLTRLREVLGADDPLVKKVLGMESPDDLAGRVVRATRLADPVARRALWDGGAAAIEASDDPLIRLSRVVDPEARAIRRKWEDEVEGPIKKNSEQIARARFAIEGAATYPDATFTLRASYGAVSGWEEDGRRIEPLTYFGGIYERATGRPPFALSKRWLDAKAALDMKTPFDFCSTNDIIGGNSGSPLVDRKGEVVGLAFDGNLPSLGGDYAFDPAVNRTVSVHSRGILHALDKVYHATRLVEELTPRPAR